MTDSTPDVTLVEILVPTGALCTNATVTYTGTVGGILKSNTETSTKKLLRSIIVISVGPLGIFNTIAHLLSQMRNSIDLTPFASSSGFKLCQRVVLRTGEQRWIARNQELHKISILCHHDTFVLPSVPAVLDGTFIFQQPESIPCLF